MESRKSSEPLRIYSTMGHGTYLLRYEMFVVRFFSAVRGVPHNVVIAGWLFLDVLIPVRIGRLPDGLLLVELSFTFLELYTITDLDTRFMKSCC